VWFWCSSHCCCCRYSGASKNRPTIFELSGGSIEKDKVKNEWDNYESSYGKEAGQGIKDRWVKPSKGPAQLCACTDAGLFSQQCVGSHSMIKCSKCRVSNHHACSKLATILLYTA
jgi:hypothetical protein